MLSHDRIWAAIDLIAQRNALTTSGLARKAGLDPTTFNRSKRVTSDGRARWPSTESIAKVLEATGEQIEDFVLLLAGQAELEEAEQSYHQVPMIGLAQAGAGGFFDDGGFPAGPGWGEASIPRPATAERVYALTVSGSSMLPLYRDGDVLIVAPRATCRTGDRVVVRTRPGEVLAMVLREQATDRVVLGAFNPDHPSRIVACGEIDWMARIVWASQ